MLHHRNRLGGFAHVLRLLLIFGFLLVGVNANALIPKVSGTEYQSQSGVNLPWYSDVMQACQSGLPKTQQNNPQGTNWSITFTSQSCVYHYTDEMGSRTYVTSLYNMRNVLSCPANSTVSGTACQCNTNYVENAAKTACEPKKVTCTVGQVISSGFFDAGSEIAKGPPYIVCSAGCAAAFDGEFPAGNALVGGKRHYFAQGSYANNGSNCDSGGGPGMPSGDGNVPDPNEVVPPDTCGPGEAAGVVNGKAVCAPDMSQPGDGTTPPKTPEAPTSDDKKTSQTNIESQTNPDGSKTVTTTTTTRGVDGTSTTTKTVDTYNPDGSKRSSSSTTTGSGVTKEAEDKDKDKKAEKCEKNSSDTGCGGDPKAVDSNGLYTKKEATVKGALESAAATLRGSPIGAAVTGFFVVGSGGSCPTATAMIPFLERTITLDFYCTSFATNALLLLRIVLLLIASWMAFRIAIE